MPAFWPLLALPLLAATPSADPAKPRYELQAALDPATSEIHGTALVTFTNTTGRPLKEIAFQLYPNNFRADSRFRRKTASQVNLDVLFHDGPDEGWLRVEEAFVDGSAAAFREAETAGFVQLENLLPPGGQAGVKLRFRTRVPRMFDRFGRLGESFSLAYWYPRLGVPTADSWDTPWREELFQEFHDVRADFKVRLEVPGAYTVGATGRRTGVEDLPGSRKALTYEAHDVGNFAAVADPALIETEAQEGHIRIHVLTRREEAPIAAALARQTADCLRFYGQLLGPYPYSDFTVVDSVTVPNFGVELPQLVLLDRQVLGIERWLGWGVELGLDLLNAHEVAHQWFYGLIGNDEAQAPFLDEGFTTYITRRYIESELSGAGGFPARFVGPLSFLNVFHLNLSERESAYRDSLVEDLAGLARPLSSAARDLSFGQFGLVYHRGSAVIEMLHSAMGDDAFDRFLKLLYERLLFREASLEAVEAIAGEAAGKPMGWFFDTWVRGADRRLDYRLASWRETPGPTGRRQVEARIEQLGDTDLPVPVAAVLRDGSQARGQYRPGTPAVLLDLPEGSASPVDYVAVDPDLSTLDMDFTNNGRLPLALFPLAGGAYPDRLALAIGARATEAASGAALTASLASIRGLAVEMGGGLTAAGPEYSLQASHPVFGTGNTESRVSAKLRQGPDGLALLGETRLAWQPRAGENPTGALTFGAQRKLLQADLASPSYPAGTQVTAVSLDLDYDARARLAGGFTMEGLRAPGPRMAAGVEVGLPVLGTATSYVFPHGAIGWTVPVGWLTSLSARAVAGSTVSGSRASADAVMMEGLGGFRTPGLGAGNHLAALNLDLSFPLGGAIFDFVIPFPLHWAGLVHISGGWTGDRLPDGGPTGPWVGEAGVGLRTGLFGNGSGMVGVDWTPYNTKRGAEWGQVTFGTGFGF